MKRHTISTLLLIAGCLAPIPVRAQARTATPAEGLSIDRAAWVAGCWRMEDGTRQMEEQWMAPAGGVMLGMNRSLRDGEFRGYELLILKEGDGGLIYEAHPSGQMAAEFASTGVTDTLLVFENPTHDFPQKLVYHRIGSDSIHVGVFGAVADDEPAFEVPLGRIRCAGSEGPEASPQATSLVPRPD